MTGDENESLSMWTIYKRGTDGYHGYTARRWHVTAGRTEPGNTLRTPYLWRLRIMMRNAGLVRLLRDGRDPMNVIETWL